MGDEQQPLVPNCPICGEVGEHDLLVLGGCFVKNILRCSRGHHWLPRTGELVRQARLPFSLPDADDDAPEPSNRNPPTNSGDPVG